MTSLQDLKVQARALKVPGYTKMNRKNKLESALALCMRAKELGIRWFMEIDEVEAAVNKVEAYGSIRCNDCLLEQLKQKAIDTKAYNEGLLDYMKRELALVCCKKKNLILDGEVLVCGNCGVVAEEGEVVGSR